VNKFKDEKKKIEEAVAKEFKVRKVIEKGKEV